MPRTLVLHQKHSSAKPWNSIHISTICGITALSFNIIHTTGMPLLGLLSGFALGKFYQSCFSELQMFENQLQPFLLRASSLGMVVGNGYMLTQSFFSNKCTVQEGVFSGLLWSASLGAAISPYLENTRFMNGIHHYTNSFINILKPQEASLPKSRN